jgi:pyruvate dehydrogenase E1 component
MPDFWQFPTVSMGLGPMMAIYQARFMRYLEHRGLADTAATARSGAFLGDGEMDEPESLGAITMPVREKLDNLVFVINCNLQRLDGPVRGNGKIIQELEAAFRGAGWNVIKVLWGSRWDPLLPRHQRPAAPPDEECRRRRVPELQGQGRRLHARALLRQVPELKEMVANMSDEEIWRLNRGGHDARKVHAAYRAAMKHRGPADGDPRQDGQGFRHGRRRRRPHDTHQRRSSTIEDLKFPRPLQHPGLRPGYRARCRTAVRRRTARRSNTCRNAVALGGYLPARGASRQATRGAAARGVRGAAGGRRASARSRRPWRWSACSAS